MTENQKPRSRGKRRRPAGASRTERKPGSGGPDKASTPGRRPPRSRSGPRNEAPPSRPAPAAAKPAAAQAPPKPPTHTGTLSLSAWDLARTRTKRPDTPRGQVMTLRSHQKLVSSFEKERRIPDPDQSFLRVKENAKGSCLFIHGVSTRPADLRTLANEFFEADYNVYVLRLPDYGTPGHTISEVSWESSLLQARQCFRLLTRGAGKVHVVGLGFGATLAVHLALNEKVTSLVLLSPAIMPRESWFQRFLVRMKLHHYPVVHRWLGWNADLMEGMDKARGQIGRIRVPIYAAQCEDDDRASPTSLRFLQRKAQNPSSRFKIFPEGGHQILDNHGEQGLFKEILGFCGA